MVYFSIINAIVTMMWNRIKRQLVEVVDND